MSAARPGWGAPLLAITLTLVAAEQIPAQAVNATVDLHATLAVMPDYGMGVHASVYDNSLQFSGSGTFNQLNSLLDNAGVNVLRYPGGGYADVFHFSLSRPGGMVGNGLTPWWGEPSNYGYMGPKTDFGNFVKLLDATASQTVITVNTGGAVKFASTNQLGVPTHGGQPQEAAAWVAYANGNAALFGTPQDVALGVDAEGNDWKTAGYWAKLRASPSVTTPDQNDEPSYAEWAGTAGVYDSRNAFLAIDRDAPVGVKYWEIGNETFGTAYYGGSSTNRGFALNYAAPYNGSDGTLRDDNPALSPAAYGQQVNVFTKAMKAIDPNIKVGAVLATPRTDVNNPIGDYSWSYADLNDDHVKQPDEPYWNDEVLSHNDAGLGKVADNVDFVIAHWYPGGSSNSIVNEPRNTIPVMLNGVTAGQDVGSNAGLRDSIAAWRTDGNARALEIFITETDGVGSPDSSSTSQRADGLFAADAYATFFGNGVSNVDWLELHQNSATTHNGSFLNESANAPNYAYWGIQSVHLMAEPGDNLVATSASDATVRIHAARQSGGTVAVMVINTNGSSSRTVDISIAGSTLADAGVRWETNGDAALASTNLTDLGNTFTTTIAARTLQVFLIPSIAVPGDFTADGLVDGDDFLAWQRGESPNPLSADDLADWTAHFGPASASNGASVPEPTTCVLVVAAILAARRWRSGIRRGCTRI